MERRKFSREFKIEAAKMVSEYVIDGGTVPTVLDVHFDVTNIIILALSVATQLAVTQTLPRQYGF